MAQVLLCHTGRLAQSLACRHAKDCARIIASDKREIRMTQAAISLDSAVLLATVSRRTLWRRVQDGQIGRCGTDERGRALLALEDLRPLLCIRLDEDTDAGRLVGEGEAERLAEVSDAARLVEADRGNAEAQNELGILCLEQAQAGVALHWFNLAAAQNHADAMHHLSRLYLHGFENSGGGLGRSRQIAARPCYGSPKRLCMAMRLPGNSWPSGQRPDGGGGACCMRA